MATKPVRKSATRISAQTKPAGVKAAGAPDATPRAAASAGAPATDLGDLSILLGAHLAEVDACVEAWMRDLAPRGERPPAPVVTGRAAPETDLPQLLGAHLAEVEARIDALGQSIRRRSDGAVAASSPVDMALAGEQDPAPAMTLLRRFDFTASYDGWFAHQQVTLGAGGEIELRQSKSTPGVATTPIAASGGLVCVRVSLAQASGGRDPAPALRVVAEDGSPLSGDTPCGPGETDVFVFLPRRTSKFRLYLIALKPFEGAKIKVKSIALYSVDPESYRASVARRVGAPVIAAMASIPQRREMMVDAVESLLLQCDRVRVFLNEYPDVPDVLRHERIDVRRSQAFDDKGDAGKFGWIDEADAPGYRVIVDDDLVFPPNFVTEMVAACRRYDDRVFTGLHGVLLRQPIDRYYAPSSRSAFHFQSQLPEDRTVHLLGTNAFCYHSDVLKLRWADFSHRNMADIFVAVYAQKNAIPMVAVARHRNWVIENKQEGGYETIYQNSLSETRSRFDSSLVQDALVKHAFPLSLMPTPRPKIVFCLLATSIEDCKEAIDTWKKKAWSCFDWSIIICQARQDAALGEWISSVSLPFETHILNQAQQSPKARFHAAISLAQRLGGDTFCLATDAIRFLDGAWPRETLTPARGGQNAIVFGYRVDGASEALRYTDQAENGGPLPVITVAAMSGAIAAGDVDQRQHALIGAIMDWHHRLCLTASPPKKPRSRPNLPAMLACAPGDQLSTRHAGPAASDLRSKVGWRRISTSQMSLKNVNDVFGRVCVINLERRRDRWESMRPRLEQAGIRADRVPAVDGQRPEIKAEFEAYARQPIVEIPPEVRQVKTSREFFADYDSQMARVAYEENKLGRKAVSSAGAWAYLATWQAILERALADQVEAILVFDDDVAFHHNFAELFAAAYRELPPDWAILQLGTLQYNWDAESVVSAGRHLYRTNGRAIGSHAVGVRFELYPFLLDLVKRRDMPFDIGALAAATLAYKERCFVTLPNAAIQFLHDSDIGTSEFQKLRTIDSAAETYRWHLPDYNV